MIKFSFEVPSWFLWLVPHRQEHERRAEVTGRASRSYLFGMITIEARKQS
jgi:hypothetical protein